MIELTTYQRNAVNELKQRLVLKASMDNSKTVMASMLDAYSSYRH